MKRVLFVFIFLTISSSCSSMDTGDLLNCSVNAVEFHYSAIHEKDIGTLKKLYGEDIDWSHSFPENFTHEIIAKKIIGSGSDKKGYIRVKEKYAEREIYMNFSIVVDDGGCRIDSYNADEPKELLPEDFEKHPRNKE